jgi:hypothetical protein
MLGEAQQGLDVEAVCFGLPRGQDASAEPRRWLWLPQEERKKNPAISWLWTTQADNNLLFFFLLLNAMISGFKHEQINTAEYMKGAALPGLAWGV